MNRIVTKPTKWHVRPAKTQISLGIRPVWSDLRFPLEENLGPWLPIKRGCPGWSESSLGAHAILLVLSRCGSYYKVTLRFAYQSGLRFVQKVKIIFKFRDFLKVLVCKYKNLTRECYQKYSFTANSISKACCLTGLVQRNKPVKFAWIWLSVLSTAWLKVF